MQGIKLDLNDYNEEDEHGDFLCIICQRRLDILHSEGFIMERILKSPNLSYGFVGKVVQTLPFPHGFQ